MKWEYQNFITILYLNLILMFFNLKKYLKILQFQLLKNLNLLIKIKLFH